MATQTLTVNLLYTDGTQTLNLIPARASSVTNTTPTHQQSGIGIATTAGTGFSVPTGFTANFSALVVNLSTTTALSLLYKVPGAASFLTDALAPGAMLYRDKCDVATGFFIATGSGTAEYFACFTGT